MKHIPFMLLSICFLPLLQSCKKVHPKTDNTEFTIPPISGASVATTDGGIIFVDENSDLTRLNSEGRTMWKCDLGSTEIQMATKLIKYSNEDVLLAGTKVYRDPFFTQLFYHTCLVRVGSNGAVKWVKSYLDSNLYLYTTIEDGIALPNDEICISTNQKFVFETGNKASIKLLKIDANGTLISQRKMDAEFMHLHVANDQKILATYEHYNDDAIVTSLDFDFNTLWEVPLMGYKSVEAFQDDLGLIFSPSNGSPLFLTALDQTGNVRWQKSYPDLIDCKMVSIRNYTTGGYVITGTKNKSTGSEIVSDVFFLRIDANGEQLFHSIIDVDKEDNPVILNVRTNDILIAGESYHTEYDPILGSPSDKKKAIWLSLNEKGELK